MRVPGADRVLQRISWVPDARFKEGFLADGGHPAVGWQIPQPWVCDADGTKVRFDDVLKRRWAVLYTDSPPVGAQAWADLGAPLIHVDEPTLVRWLRRKKATAVVLRPDGFIYAASRSGQPLPASPPPSRLIETGVPA